MNIGELFIALGFDVDDKKLKEFNENLKSGLKDMAAMGAAAAATVYAIDTFVDGSIRSATALRNFNTETGNSIEALQKWQAVTVLTNAAMTADQVTASFKALSEAIGAARFGGGPLGKFQMLGLSNVSGKDPGQVLEELRANYQSNIARWGLNRTNALMKDVGVDLGMLQALQLSSDEFDKKARNRYLTAAQQKNLVELGNAISDVEQKLGLFRDQISAEYSPALINFIKNATPQIKEFAGDMVYLARGATELFKSLNPPEQEAILAFLTLLVIRLNPVAAAITAIAIAADQLSRAFQGKSNWAGELMLLVLNRMKSEDGSAIATIKRNLAANGNGAAENIVSKGSLTDPEQSVPPAFWNSPLYRPPSSMEDRMMQNNQVMMNNAFHIHSAADAFAISDQIVAKQKSQITKSFTEFNNGPVR